MVYSLYSRILISVSFTTEVWAQTHSRVLVIPAGTTGLLHHAPCSGDTLRHSTLSLRWTCPSLTRESPCANVPYGPLSRLRNGQAMCRVFYVLPRSYLLSSRFVSSKRDIEETRQTSIRHVILAVSVRSISRTAVYYPCPSYHV